MPLQTVMGMTKRELESEVRWRMRRAPEDPKELHDYLTDLMVELIDKNNAAIAESLAERDRVDLPEDG